MAGDIVQRDGKVNCRATIIDWPGLGYSHRPKIDYNADVLEKFLAEFINAPNSPIQQPGFYDCLCLFPPYVNHCRIAVLSYIVLE